MSASRQPPQLAPFVREAQRNRLRVERERRNLKRFARLSIVLTLASAAFLVGGTLLRAIGDAAQRIAMR